jgi:hypothetical protein
VGAWIMVDRWVHLVGSIHGWVHPQTSTIHWLAVNSNYHHYTAAVGGGTGGGQ